MMREFGRPPQTKPATPDLAIVGADEHHTRASRGTNGLKMAYDEALAERIRAILADRADVTERRMFGGLAFMVGDRMAVGVMHDDLMVRLGADATAEALSQPHVRPMDFTGRPAKGMVYVAPAGVDSDAELARWVQASVAHVASLPPR